MHKLGSTLLYILSLGFLDMFESVSRTQTTIKIHILIDV